ncbi:MULTISPECIES: response regulator transcription factor [unclassified Pedobacter]|uniref:response regulator transcription factor n=1 Tax=unclassified Pedobacter TaxID=2628915 RepID=UPI00142107FD|nr:MULTISPECIES: response regulator transcription factor [unclassified Pedobacter]NII83765.1 DNA-binding response OmpR family regulator [Pedobacter sp. SG908]NMN37621.1 DNA-binding response OmpR family regulator [Pedobacter sp. SG918]
MQILVIEDELRVAEMIQKGLTELGFQVTLAYDGEMGKKLALFKPFDLILLDLVLPKINGIDLCNEIRRNLPHIPIIMLTALGTTDDKIEGFDAGANDYLVKPFDFRELHARIRALINRTQSLNNGFKQGFILRFADLEMNLETKIVKRNHEQVNLTPKEFRLLEYMMSNSERVLSRTEIAEKVWDTFDSGTNFIDVYINYLRKKIDKDHAVKLIHTKPGMGFIFKEG